MNKKVVTRRGLYEGMTTTSEYDNAFESKEIEKLNSALTIKKLDNSLKLEHNGKRRTVKFEKLDSDLVKVIKKMLGIQ